MGGRGIPRTPGDKAKFIRDGLDLLRTQYPRLKAAVYWHERWQNDDNTYSNLRVNSSVEALEAIAKASPNPGWLERADLAARQVTALADPSCVGAKARLTIRLSRLAMRERERLRFFQDVPRDHQALHFRSAFADRAELRVPQVALDRQVAAVAIAAMNLH